MKTGVDSAATKIVGTPEYATTIAKLRSVAAPATLPPDTRIVDPPIEMTMWTVDATLTGYKLETDQDYHPASVATKPFPQPWW